MKLKTMNEIVLTLANRGYNPRLVRESFGSDKLYINKKNEDSERLVQDFVELNGHIIEVIAE